VNAASAVPSPAVLVAAGLHKRYRAGDRTTAALRGVDLTVHPGEWVAVVGPSGSGKSTLLQVLGGLDVPDEGSVRLGDDELSALTEGARAVLRRTRIGFVFQFFNLLGDLTVAENVALPLLLAGSSRADARDRVAELLRRLGIADAADAAPGELSGGQQQRVALARALANRPRLLLADEPTGNLDSEAARHVLDLVRAEHDRGQAIVMVTHDPAVAAAADRVCVMRDGQVRAERTLDRVTATRSVLELMEADA
jgi:putative ABC transport system ATP-binding protein